MNGRFYYSVATIEVNDDRDLSEELQVKRVWNLSMMAMDDVEDNDRSSLVPIVFFDFSNCAFRT